MRRRSFRDRSDASIGGTVFATSLLSSKEGEGSDEMFALYFSNTLTSTSDVFCEDV